MSHYAMTGQVNALGLLASEHRFVSYGIETTTPEGGMVAFFFLFSREPEIGFRFSARMVDIAERDEVGVLHIDTRLGDPPPRFRSDLPEPFMEIVEVERLVLFRDRDSFDSGLILTGQEGSELILVSGAFPYSIEVQAKPRLDLIEAFDPAYSLEEYKRQPLLEGK